MSESRRSILVLLNDMESFVRDTVKVHEGQPGDISLVGQNHNGLGVRMRILAERRRNIISRTQHIVAKNGEGTTFLFDAAFKIGALDLEKPSFENIEMLAKCKEACEKLKEDEIRILELSRGMHHSMGENDLSM